MYILTINAIRLHVVNLTIGKNGIVICVHVCLCELTFFFSCAMYLRLEKKSLYTSTNSIQTLKL